MREIWAFCPKNSALASSSTIYAGREGAMSKNITIARNLLLGMTILVLGAGAAIAQTEIDAEAGWSPPSYGTPVVYYILQHSVNDADWATVAAPTDTVYTLQITVGESHRIRVAGVDAEGRQGPFSAPSDSYLPVDENMGVPGAPGQPFPF